MKFKVKMRYRVVILMKYIESYDDTEYSFFVKDDKGTVKVFVQYLCGCKDSYNQVVARKCSKEKFDRIIAMKLKDRAVTPIGDKYFNTEAEVDSFVNDRYTKLRKEKHLDADWFNGHGL